MWMPYIWLAITVATIVIEIITLGNLICIWFSIGGLVAWLLAILHCSQTVQIMAFFVVSILAMIVVRPLAYRYLKGTITPTNSDRLIGRSARLTSPILENKWGQLQIDGTYWSVVSADQKPIAEGTLVTIINIDGSKLVVEAQ